MDHIRTLLPKVLRKRGLHDQADAALVVYHAQRWLVEHLPSFQKELSVTHYKDGSLVITSSHSIAAQECKAVQEDLCSYLREECDHSGIKEIRINRA